MKHVLLISQWLNVSRPVQSHPSLIQKYGTPLPLDFWLVHILSAAFHAVFQFHTICTKTFPLASTSRLDFEKICIHGSLFFCFAEVYVQYKVSEASP